jgi:hypothetical protein
VGAEAVILVANNCQWCARRLRPDGTCRTCTSKAATAYERVADGGEPIELVSRELQVPVKRVRRWIHQEADRRDVTGYRLDSVPTARVRELIRLYNQRHPERLLSMNSLAARLGIEEVNFRRKIGSIPMAPGTRGRQCDADGYRRAVEIDLAERIARVLGFDPVEMRWRAPAGSASQLDEPPEL